MIAKSGNRFSDKIMLDNSRSGQVHAGFGRGRRLTLCGQSWTLRPEIEVRMGAMKRIVTAGLLAVLAGVLLQVESAPAQTAAPGVRMAQAGTVYVAPRKLRRVPVYPRDHYDPDVYPRYNPGPNAVRVCNAYYVQEARPSGTVITPRMSCYWRPG
jgi:hypothetical protein